jgi:hypothetical protein
MFPRILTSRWRSDKRESGNGHQTEGASDKILDVTLIDKNTLFTELGSRLTSELSHFGNFLLGFGVVGLGVEPE